MKLENMVYEFLRENGATEIAVLSEHFLGQDWSEDEVRIAVKRLCMIGRAYEWPKGTLKHIPDVGMR